ncbi:MAG: hypothetical protein J6X36_09460 [Lachnospiraceae bacterium]|jgi:hypothetical protein|nr:hypothetical protein [Lachnospiraceae bacterium]
MAGKEIERNAANVDDIVKMLDNFASSEEGRLKVKVSEELEEGTVKREYHLGRCDINSAFACGIPFDVLDITEDE